MTRDDRFARLAPLLLTGVASAHAVGFFGLDDRPALGLGDAELAASAIEVGEAMVERLTSSSPLATDRAAAVLERCSLDLGNRRLLLRSLSSAPGGEPGFVFLLASADTASEDAWRRLDAAATLASPPIPAHSIS
ncbi:MAG: hypothetical protein AAGN46_08010 [Acidobacteriota bacterium]